MTQRHMFSMIETRSCQISATLLHLTTADKRSSVNLTCFIYLIRFKLCQFNSIVSNLYEFCLVAGCYLLNLLST